MDLQKAQKKCLKKVQAVDAKTIIPNKQAAMNREEVKSKLRWHLIMSIPIRLLQSLHDKLF